MQQLLQKFGYLQILSKLLCTGYRMANVRRVIMMLHRLAVAPMCRRVRGMPQSSYLLWAFETYP